MFKYTDIIKEHSTYVFSGNRIVSKVIFIEKIALSNRLFYGNYINSHMEFIY